MANTVKANVIIPEVLADYVQSKLTDKSVFAPIAEIDNTLENRGEGDSIKFPKYAYIGAAAGVNEGASIGVTNLSTTSVTKTVSKIAKGVGITDEAMLSAYGNPTEEIAKQLAVAIDDKVDADCLTELGTLNAAKSYIITTDLSSDAIIDALTIFGEDEQGQKALFLNSANLAALRKDDDYIKASDIGSDQVIRGATGMIWGCNLINTNRLASSGDSFIVKPGAIRIINQRGLFVEAKRDADTQTTGYYASKLYVPYLQDESKVIKITKRTSVKAVTGVTSVAGTSSGDTQLDVPYPAPANCKWVYKLGSADVTPTWGTAVSSYTDLTPGADIAASTNTKASVILVFKADDKPIDYANVTLVKKA